MIRVRQGRTVREYFPSDKRLITIIAATDDAKVLDVGSRFLVYKRELERGELEVLGEGVIRGRPAIQVKRQALSGPITITAWLDRETLLPLEETFTTLTLMVIPVKMKTLWSYTTIEHIPWEQVPAEETPEPYLTPTELPNQLLLTRERDLYHAIQPIMRLLERTQVDRQALLRQTFRFPQGGGVIATDYRKPTG